MRKKLTAAEVLASEFMIPTKEDVARKEFDKAARMLKMLFDSLTEVGFTEEQAMILLLNSMRKG